ncbi:MAG TPA: hypothetical protein VN969_27875 [Streptosporangiaceae bacterium]|nr:hypothetical protein [Streptosporangiaceae bacterium]
MGERRNRVTPYGELIAVPDRGMFWGNRGALVDDHGRLARYSRGRAWMICVLEYKGIRRQQWTPRRLTELYFLDEATALAAGHRPCGECRYRDYQEFKRCWAAAHGGPLPRVADIDTRLHADRLLAPVGGSVRRDRFAGASVRRRYRAAVSELPDGAMVSVDSAAFLVLGGRLLRWSAGGYLGVLEPAGEADVITPLATVAALAAGYRPVLHPTCATTQS